VLPWQYKESLLLLHFVKYEHNNLMNDNQEIPSGDELQQTVKHKQYVMGAVTKQLIILLCGLVLLVSFFLLPANKTWLKEKVIAYWNDFTVQRKQLSEETRKTKRFGTEYTYSKQIADLFKARTDNKNALVLIPPAAYFTKQGLDYPVPEPVTFYYFTNLKTVWANHDQAITANWYVTVHEKKFSIDSITNTQQLKDTITAFKKYE
jgi:hypothetical protein